MLQEPPSLIALQLLRLIRWSLSSFRVPVGFNAIPSLQSVPGLRLLPLVPSQPLQRRRSIPAAFRYAAGTALPRRLNPFLASDPDARSPFKGSVLQPDPCQSVGIRGSISFQMPTLPSSGFRTTPVAAQVPS